MLLKSRLTEQEYINASFVLLYSKPFIKIVTGMIFLLLVVIIVTAVALPEASFSQGIFPVVMLIVIPLMTYLTAKRSYASNKIISESVEYNFENDFLSIKGESFNAQLSWEKMFKITKTKNWVFIWQNKQVANPISRRLISDAEISFLKEILDRHKVKNDL